MKNTKKCMVCGTPLSKQGSLKVCSVSCLVNSEEDYKAHDVDVFDKDIPINMEAKVTLQKGEVVTGGQIEQYAQKLMGIHPSHAYITYVQLEKIRVMVLKGAFTYYFHKVDDGRMGLFFQPRQSNPDWYYIRPSISEEGKISRHSQDTNLLPANVVVNFNAIEFTAEDKIQYILNLMNQQKENIISLNQQIASRKKLANIIRQHSPGAAKYVEKKQSTYDWEQQLHSAQNNLESYQKELTKLKETGVI